MHDELWNTFGVSQRPSGARFVGREAEFDELCRALVNLESTGARTVLVGGDAGIGKTRLAEEFVDRARSVGEPPDS